jgi:lysophospholipase L1-like esterase
MAIVVLLSTLTFFSCSGCHKSPDKKQEELSTAVRWVGRVDTTDQKKPRFSWSGSGFVARFSGSQIMVKIKNDSGFFFQPVMDGILLSRVELKSGEDTYTAKVSIEKPEHIFEFYRDTEGYYGASQLLEITVDGGTLLEPPLFSGRTIEVIGDSISCGYGNLGDEQHVNWGATNLNTCKFSFSTESAYQSYGWMAAREFQADASIVAISGFGMYQSITGSLDDVMPKYYNRTIGNSESPLWSHKNAKPQVVVINLGTNDFYTSGKTCPTISQENYVNAYLSLIETVRSENANAWIFCTIGPMI